MSEESLIAASQRLNVSMEALAALGAELRVRTEGLDCDPRIRELLKKVVAAIGPQFLEAADPVSDTATLGFIRSFFRQASDLLNNPERPPGWSYDDPIILQAQGQASRQIVRVIAGMSAQRPSLLASLSSAGAFIDVGTGVGWLAIDAARTWPTLTIVGIDPWDPALALARANVAASNLGERIVLRRQSVADLEEFDSYAVAWLAGPFIGADTIDRALALLHRALVPGGTLIFGLYEAPPTPLGEALTELRVVRSGGHAWTVDQVTERLRATGFEDVASFSLGPPIRLIAGSKSV